MAHLVKMLDELRDVGAQIGDEIEPMAKLQTLVADLVAEFKHERRIMCASDWPKNKSAALIRKLEKMLK